MRYNATILIIALFAITLFSACQSSSKASDAETVKQIPAVTVTPANLPPESVPKDDAPRISLEEAKSDFDKKVAVFVDTRNEDAYKVEHIKDAINLPLDAVEKRFKELPKDKKIIAYCS